MKCGKIVNNPLKIELHDVATDNMTMYSALSTSALPGSPFIASFGIAQQFPLYGQFSWFIRVKIENATDFKNMG